ncbi:MAG UNVERIFIED_CONTAM: hypothetical protein LVR18_50125 [Planctomycetaceae bacterium]
MAMNPCAFHVAAVLAVRIHKKLFDAECDAYSTRNRIDAEIVVTPDAWIDAMIVAIQKEKRLLGKGREHKLAGFDLNDILIDGGDAICQVCPHK